MRNRIRHALRSFIAGTLNATGEPRASSSRPTGGTAKVQGTILETDPIGREVQVLVNRDSMRFYVPFGSIVQLNDERVALRMLQPLDQAELQYRVEHGVAIADSVVAYSASAALHTRITANSCSLHQGPVSSSRRRETGYTIQKGA